MTSEKWKCNECGYEEKYERSSLTTSANEPMPAHGWGCLKCDKGKMELVKPT